MAFFLKVVSQGKPKHFCVTGKGKKTSDSATVAVEVLFDFEIPWSASDARHIMTCLLRTHATEAQLHRDFVMLPFHFKYYLGQYYIYICRFLHADTCAYLYVYIYTKFAPKDTYIVCMRILYHIMKSILVRAWYLRSWKFKIPSQKL